MDDHPFPALILVLDLRGFSGLTNPDQLAARTQAYGVVDTAFAGAGLSLDDCAHEDRGDGLVIVAPPTTPKTVLMGPVLSALIRGVQEAPPIGPGWTMAMRIAAHAGEVHHDGRGFVGSDVNLTFRLADSDVLRDALARTASRSVVMVSDALYQSTAKHRYPGMADRVFNKITVSAKETTTDGWLHIPGDPATAAALSEERRRPAARASAAAEGVFLQAGRDISANGGIIAAGNVSVASWPHQEGGTR